MPQLIMQSIIQTDPNNVFFRCVEDSNEAIMITDRDGRLSYVNPAWAQVYGYSREEVIGRSPNLIRSGHQDAEFYGKMWSQIQDPQIGYWKGELINQAKDGRLVPVLLTITPFKNMEGDIVGYMGVALDVTLQKEMEKKLLQGERLASVGLLASGLAHEIGTPLGVIRGRAEFMQLQAQDNPNVLKGIEVITGQIDRISKLIQSLLNLSRNNTLDTMVPFSVRDIVENLRELLKGKSDRSKLEFRVNIDGKLRVMGDPDRLSQILLNLVMNSIHAIEEAERTQSRTSGHQIRIWAEQKGASVLLHVEDTGCGIREENMVRIFEPFFTTKAAGQGTGLGLAMCFKLMSEMHGDIRVQSNWGSGTSFTLVLPMARPLAALDTPLP